MSGRAEQLVEEVAEPGFKYVNFGLRDGNAPGPVVHHLPGLEIVRGRPADARRRRADIAVEIVRQYTGRLTPGTAPVGMKARSRHPDRFARSPAARNDPILRHATLSIRFLRCGMPAERHRTVFACSISRRDANRMLGRGRGVALRKTRSRLTHMAGTTPAISRTASNFSFIG